MTSKYLPNIPEAFMKRDERWKQDLFMKQFLEESELGTSKPIKVETYAIESPSLVQHNSCEKNVPTRVETYNINPPLTSIKKERKAKSYANVAKTIAKEESKGSKKEEKVALSLSKKIERAGVIMVKGEKYLLALGLGHDKWGFPKGSREEKETIMETAIRECYEETGIKLEKSELSEENTLRFKHSVYYSYTCARKLNFDVKDKTEVKKIKWMTIEEMKALPNANRDLKLFLRNK